MFELLSDENILSMNLC